MWLGVVIGMYGNGGHLFTAVQAGTAAGVAVCVIGETVASSIPFLPPAPIITTTQQQEHEDESARLVPLCVSAYTIIAFCHWIFTDVPSHYGPPGRTVTFYQQVLLAISCGATLHVASCLFLRYENTRRMGAVMQRRGTDIARNWEEHPLRSAAESFATMITVWATWYACGDR
jgi:hypothetical protein